MFCVLFKVNARTQVIYIQRHPRLYIRTPPQQSICFSSHVCTSPTSLIINVAATRVQPFHPSILRVHPQSPVEDLPTNAVRTPGAFPPPYSTSAPQGFVNCSFLNQRKKPAHTMICAINPTQNHASRRPCRLVARLGKMGPGPVASGAQARATMVATDPRTCAHTKANTTWNRVSVWRRIMPKPTPWMASRVPSHSQRDLPARAPASGEPAQGTQDPMPEVAHSI